MMPRVGRPRKDGNKDLPPGLYVDTDGYYYVTRSITLPNGDKEPRSAYLHTKDVEQAKGLYWTQRATWDDELLRAQAKQIAERLIAINRPAGKRTFADYCKYYREKKLPTAKTRSKKPRLLSTHTREDYRRILENAAEVSEHLAVPLNSADDVVLRKFLSRWLDNPSHYNYVMSILSRVIRCAIDEGELRHNPLANVERRQTSTREVYVPDDDYALISRKLPEWQARACDLIYFASHRPGDCLALAESNVSVEVVTFKNPDESIEKLPCTVVRFTATKNDQPMEIVDKLDGPLTRTLQWFRDFKKEQDFLRADRLPFVVFPKTSRRRSIGKPVRDEYISRKFAAAIVAAGIAKGKYQLRDLRKKGLTDEARIAGKPTNKGGHKTDAMMRLYVVGELPMRVQNNLREMKR